MGSAAITNLARMTSNGYNGYAANILVSKEIKVNLDGSVELVSPTSRRMTVASSSERYTIDVNSDELLGAGNRYFTPSEDSESNSQRCTLLIPPGTVYYVAPGTTYTTAMRSIGFTSAFNAAQLVTGVPGTPAIPAGTTTTYPVSTNPNAYQEGGDAKPARYTLGEVVTGTISVCPSTSSEEGWRYTSNQDSIVVSDAGEVSMSGNDTNMLYANSVSASPFDVLRGKYVKCPKINADLSDMIVYFPSDAVFSLEGDSPFRIIVNKYQPITATPLSQLVPLSNTLGSWGIKRGCRCFPTSVLVPTGRVTRTR